ncbi:MAG TPA: hypothetical protein VJU82_17460 [Acidobacteriaceae bacterium]|nr:hypothetical protein [Acidobacteriaceae bacterium]
MDHRQIEAAQKTFCSQKGTAFVPTCPDDKIGFASSTSDLRPINGLRHPPTPGTSGWYLWCGEAFSESADFFEPQHARHVYESLPEAAQLFGLPPGYRFLLAGDYLDVWYDEQLLFV